MALAAEALAALGVRLARRPDRQHGHGGGVDRRRRPRDGARPAGRRRDRARSRAASTSGSRAAAACCRRSPSRAGPAMPASRRANPDEAAPSTRSRRWRSCSRRSGGCARTGRCGPRHPYLSPADFVPTIIAGGEWIVSLPGRRAGSTATSSTCPTQADEHGCGGRVEREFEDWIARAAAADPWLRGTRRGSSGWSAACRRPRCRRTIRSSGGARRGARDRPPERARRPRQLARRRHADRRGRHPVDLPRAGRHPPRAHDRRVGPDRRSRRLRAGARRHGDALLRRGLTKTPQRVRAGAARSRAPFASAREAHPSAQARIVSWIQW